MPGPAEDHNLATAAKLDGLWQGRDDIPAERRRDVAHFLNDIPAYDTAGWYFLISLHGGGPPAATSMEIYRSYPLEDKIAVVKSLLDRGLLASEPGASDDIDQPGRCCPEGCQTPENEKDQA